jgi:hypothetical protein
MERYDRPPEGDLANLAQRSVFIEGRLNMPGGLIERITRRAEIR